jgi:hypothetical protein
MKKKQKSHLGKKVLLLAVVFILACLATYAIFLLKINSKIEAIELVKQEYLPKERLEGFVSDINRQGKFKLEGWNIKETGEKGVFNVSYSIRWLDEGGFRTGDPVGFWFRVNPESGLCSPIQPEATVTPYDPEG